jgi:hypothetical protein
MARPPNFNFERQERERAKALKVAKKAEAKRLSRAAQHTSSSPPDEDSGGNGDGRSVDPAGDQ